jgi:hypothetical protein
MSANAVPSAVGIPWYTKESYPKCLAIFDDPADYPQTFDAWLLKAQRTANEYGQLGMRVVRVEIDPGTFRRWCAANGFRNVDAKARSHYASLQAAVEVSQTERK